MQSYEKKRLRKDKSYQERIDLLRNRTNPSRKNDFTEKIMMLDSQEDHPSVGSLKIKLRTMLPKESLESYG